MNVTRRNFLAGAGIAATAVLEDINDDKTKKVVTGKWSAKKTITVK